MLEFGGARLELFGAAPLEADFYPEIIQARIIASFPGKDSARLIHSCRDPRKAADWVARFLTSGRLGSGHSQRKYASR